MILVCLNAVLCHHHRIHLTHAAYAEIWRAEIKQDDGLSLTVSAQCLMMLRSSL